MLYIIQQKEAQLSSEAEEQLHIVIYWSFLVIEELRLTNTNGIS